MKISKAHQRFAERLQKPDALENPQVYLGSNYLTVINFWLFLDNYRSEDIRKRVSGNNKISRGSTYIQLIRQKADIITNVGYFSVYQSPYETHDNLRIVGLASWELVSMHELFQESHELQFLPLFQNL